MRTPRLALVVVLLAGCPTSPTATSTDAGKSPEASALDAAPLDAGSADAAADVDASIPSGPFTSKEGAFSIDAPAVPMIGSTSAIVWNTPRASYAVHYYDGRPHGVDSSPLYSVARDHVDGSAIEKEAEVVINGNKAKTRWLKAVLINKTVTYRRNALVVVGDRTYDVSCTTQNQDELTSPLAEGFFASFRTLGAPAAKGSASASPTPKPPPSSKP